MSGKEISKPNHKKEKKYSNINIIVILYLSSRILNSLLMLGC